MVAYRHTVTNDFGCRWRNGEDWKTSESSYSFVCMRHVLNPLFCFSPLCSHTWMQWECFQVTRPSGAVVAGILLSKQKRQRNNTQWKVSLGDSASILIKETKLGRILTPTTPDETTAAVPVSGSDASITASQQQSQALQQTALLKQPLVSKAARNKVPINRKELQQAGLTTRQGLTVRKISMKTGTLFIYVKTRQAEFVRTK